MNRVLITIWRTGDPPEHFAIESTDMHGNPQPTPFSGSVQLRDMLTYIAWGDRTISLIEWDELERMHDRPPHELKREGTRVIYKPAE